jgi:4-amino-4-deoxy-L-arabinose transferase-like glycosyltransferase
MTTIRTIIGALYDKILVAVGVLIVLLPISPLNIVQPARDSGVFLYVGWRMLHGDIPYLDVWDHKPPMIFLINALGLLIGGGSIWGVWLVELLLLFFAAVLGFTLIKRYLGSLPAIFALSLWLLSLTFVINGGNLTTEYTLIIQFASLWLAVEAEEKGYFFWRGYLIGVLAAIAFLTKQNAIGIPLAILLYLLISRVRTRQVKTLVRALLVILLGGLSVLILVLLFFVLTGAFEAFWDAAFAYNFIYVSTSLAEHFEGSVNGIRLLSNTGLAQFALLGWAAGLTLLLFKKKLPHHIVAPLSIALLALPFELILVGMSGKAYKHYYMALLPIFSIFASLAFWFILARLSDLPAGKKAGIFFTIAAIILLLFSPAVDYYRLTKTYKNPSDTLVAERIQEVTEEGDSVLLWGAETVTNFTARRRSPSRFVYQYPLYTEGYADQQKIEDFFADIVKDKPRLIIDSRNPLTPLYQFGITSPQIEESINYLRSHYHFREGVGTWTIYEYVEVPDAN